MPLAPAIPVLRIFSIDKAKEFYLDFLGFSLDWEHRFSPDLPLYMQIHRDGLILHLSEHHGDACPGSTVFARLDDLHALERELQGKTVRFCPARGRAPGLGPADAGVGPVRQPPALLPADR